jgi:hypothetical protein
MAGPSPNSYGTDFENPCVFYTGAGFLIGRMNISCYTLFVWLYTGHTKTYNYNSQGGTLFEA